MTVKISNEAVWEYFKAFSVSTSLLQEAKAKGVYATLHMGQSNRFVVLNKAGEAVGTVPVTAAVLTLAKGGKLGPASQQAIKFQLEALLAEALESSVEEQIPEVEEKMATKPHKEETVGAPTPTTTNAGPVSLKDATELYQPVYGTSQGSIYTVIALFGGDDCMKMAIRRQKSTVSFRVEGVGKADHIPALEDMGFSGKKEGHHSLHVNISHEDESLLKKTLGAIVGCIGFNYALAVGEVQKVEVVK